MRMTIYIPETVNTLRENGHDIFLTNCIRNYSIGVTNVDPSASMDTKNRSLVDGQRKKVSSIGILVNTTNSDYMISPRGEPLNRNGHNGDFNSGANYLGQSSVPFVDVDGTPLKKPQSRTKCDATRTTTTLVNISKTNTICGLLNGINNVDENMTPACAFLHALYQATNEVAIDSGFAHMVSLGASKVFPFLFYCHHFFPCW